MGLTAAGEGTNPPLGEGTWGKKHFAVSILDIFNIIVVTNRKISIIQEAAGIFALLL